MRRRSLVPLAAVLVVVACNSPTGSTQQQSQPPPPAVKAIVVHGPTRIAPGDSASFEAIAEFTDNTTQVYTTRVQWQSSNLGVLSIVSASGTATARVAGDVVVTASLGSIRGSSAVLVVPTGTYRLSGKVLESGLPVLFATVKVTAGQTLGVSTTTDFNGDYKLYGVAGPVEIQITKPGYTPVTRSIDVSRDDTLDITDFTQTGGLPSLAGAYTLTITIAGNCQPSPPSAQFPANLRTRTYTAAMTQDGPRLHVTLSGADFLIQNGRGNSFDGRVEPDGVTFSLTGLGASAYYYFYYSVGVPDLAERISPTDYLAILGKAFTKSSPSGLTGPFVGSAMVFGLQSSPINQVRVSCYSSSHQFSLTPQTGAARVRR